MKYYLIIGSLFLTILFIYFKDNFTSNSLKSPFVLIRCDDIGINNSINESIEKIAKKNIPISASVIVNSRCYSQAVEILKRNPQISVGVHLVFTSEWENDRWKPLLPKEKVQSLIDSNGYFYPSKIDLRNVNPDISEIEAEAEAQIQKLLNSGLRVDYIDSHMFFLYSHEGAKLLRKLGKKYNLIISLMNNEIPITDIYNMDEIKKLDRYISWLSNLQKGELYIIVFHPAARSDELNSMRDLNRPSYKKNGSNRYNEFCAIVSEEALQIIISNNIKLETYFSLKFKENEKL